MPDVDLYALLLTMQVLFCVTFMAELLRVKRTRFFSVHFLFGLLINISYSYYCFSFGQISLNRISPFYLLTFSLHQLFMHQSVKPLTPPPPSPTLGMIGELYRGTFHFLFSQLAYLLVQAGSALQITVFAPWTRELVGINILRLRLTFKREYNVWGNMGVGEFIIHFGPVWTRKFTCFHLQRKWEKGNV